MMVIMSSCIMMFIVLPMWGASPRGGGPHGPSGPVPHPPSRGTEHSKFTRMLPMLSHEVVLVLRVVLEVHVLLADYAG